MSKAWAGGSTTRWRKIRRWILDRDGWQCQIGIPGICTQQATHVHHTQGRHVTGDEDQRYLVAACRACNQHIGDPRKGPDPAHKPVTRW